MTKLRSVTFVMVVLAAVAVATAAPMKANLNSATPNQAAVLAIKTMAPTTNINMDVGALVMAGVTVDHAVGNVRQDATTVATRMRNGTRSPDATATKNQINSTMRRNVLRSADNIGGVVTADNQAIAGNLPDNVATESVRTGVQSQGETSAGKRQVVGEPATKMAPNFRR